MKKLPTIDLIVTEAVREQVRGPAFVQALASKIDDEVKLLTAKQVAVMWSVPVSVVRKKLTPVELGPQTHRYRLSDVKAAIEFNTPKHK